LFGKFTRLSAQSTGGESSTGLGLSIVKKLAEAMAGTVLCRSVLGEGATFILRLPASDEVESPSAKASSAIPAALDRDVAQQSPQAATPKIPAPVAQ